MKDSPFILYPLNLIGVPEETARPIRDFEYNMRRAFDPYLGHQHAGKKSDGAILDPTAFVRLAPEYPGAVLWYDTTVTAYGHSGLMSANWDAVHNYYVWTTAETDKTHEYYIVVRVPVPYNFVKWKNCKFYGRISTTAYAGTSVALVDIYDTLGTRVAPAATSVGTTSTTWEAVAFEIPSGEFTESEFMTLKFRVRAAKYQSSTYSYAYLGEVYMDAW